MINDAGSPAAARIDALARRGLAIERLRPEQREAVAAVVAGHDVLAVMPTGYGKSAIYQLAGAAVEGPTVVVSPLIALQRDQVQALTELAVGRAALVNSTIAAAARQEAFDQLRAGELEFLFLAPEQLIRAETLSELQAAPPSLFVVDEAHCISSWGHDFRPDYLRLGEVIDELGRPRVIALTATAAPPVRAEIIERLGLRQPTVIVHGFDRPNLRLRAERYEDAPSKDAALLQCAVESAGSGTGIVYVATRKRTEKLAQQLVEAGVRAVAYHAGLARARREEAQIGFMEGTADVIVATTAFGMGIDKPDVRFVLHGDIPESLDAYYQEIGRAGRDGAPADAVLFYRPSDLGLRRFLGGKAVLSPEQVIAVMSSVIEAGDNGVPTAELSARCQLPPARLKLVLNGLQEAGAVSVGDAVVRQNSDCVSPEAVAEAVTVAEDRRREMQRSRLEMMRGYAEARGCRRRFLLSYFGEDYQGDCHAGGGLQCDYCASVQADPDVTSSGPFCVGQPVRHCEFGDGVVIRTEDDTVVVLFDDVGYKTLDAQLVFDEQLLVSVD